MDQETGHLYAVAGFENDAGDTTFISVAKSEDAGDTWTEGKAIDYVEGGWQLLPAIAVSHGVVSLLWYDSRHSPATEDADFPGVDVYYAELEQDLSTRRILRLTKETQTAVHPVFTRIFRVLKAGAPEMPHDRIFEGPFISEKGQADTRECFGFGFIGDYIGIAADGENAYAIWTDMRDLETTQTICSGNDILGRRNQNVYFGRIKK